MNEKDAVRDMRDLIRQAGYKEFTAEGKWETALCAAAMALDPQCRPTRLLEALPAHDRPYDGADLLNCLSHLGYYARSIPAAMKTLDPRLFPCLFVTDRNEPHVILSDMQDALRVYDTRGVREVSKKSLKNVRGTLWLFERYDDSQSVTSDFMRAGTGHSWFRALLGRFRGTFLQILLSGLFLNILALATPIFIMLVYDRVIGVGSFQALPMLTAGAALAILFEWMLRKVRSRGLSWLAARTDNIVSNHIYTHLLDLPPALIERASISSQVSRLKTFEAVRDFFSGPVFLSMMEIPFVILSILAIYAIAGPLALVPLAMVSLYGLLYVTVQRHVKVSIRAAARATSMRQQFSLETFEKIRGIRGYGLAHKWQERFRDLSGREMMAHFRLNWLGMIGENLAHSLTLLSGVAVIGFGVHMIWTSAISTGALVACMILSWRVLTPFYSLCTMIPRLEQLRHSIMQVNKLMDISTEELEARERARVVRIRGGIDFTRVMLRYDGSDIVFSDLNLHIAPGDLVAISGENGAGKSSMLKMVKGMYLPREGALQIDGFDIRQLDAPDLRRQIAYVPQQPDFFSGTILDNLRIGNPLATHEEVEQALDLACAKEDVGRYAHGVMTPISRSDGTVFPSSLLTRLSLARAYLHPAPILLIDELPNTLLSGPCGKNLKNYLAHMKGKRTIMIVTYRDDYMRLADTQIILRRGQPPEIIKTQQEGEVASPLAGKEKVA